MNSSIFIIINLLLVIAFIKLVSKKDFLTYLQNGRWLLTWIAIGIITLMDELTSVFYANAEAHRFIGVKAIIYIALTSVLIRFLSTRMVEIAEILEANNIKGGGVYSFSYMVLGPSFSFIAISSILVDYVLTATISTASAVENGTSFLGTSPAINFILKFGVIWFITSLNIIGIKENAKFTFLIFVFAAFVLVNLIIGGALNLDSNSTGKIAASFQGFIGDLTEGSPFIAYENIIIGIGSCILAYSGIESVLQTASLVKSWKEIRKAYLFLALTVGIVTPLIALLVLSSPIDISKHETDLIPVFAALTNGQFFGIVVAILATFTLIMAVNTAMVASAELIEKIAERYNYESIIKLNKKQSLYRIHILNAFFYSAILIITSGSQAILAEMYAVGLVASFCINTGSLLMYRYSRGTKEITYKTSRTGTLILFIILLSTFTYIIIHRPYGTVLWLCITSIVLFAGLRISKYKSPEIKVRMITSTPMDVIFAIADSIADKVHIYFRRPTELEAQEEHKDSIFVSFYTPRTEQPKALSPNHFSLSIQRKMKLFDMIFGLLKTIEYEFPPEKHLHIHFGWPMSSWLDRMSIGVMIYNIIHLPKKFPKFTFHMDYFGQK
ncbi:MAG: APC family permease [Ignavibacteriales bacterium]|nr:APC family permease [Ignavibacteriales bacterium]